MSILLDDDCVDLGLLIDIQSAILDKHPKMRGFLRDFCRSQDLALYGAFCEIDEDLVNEVILKACRPKKGGFE